MMRREWIQTTGPHLSTKRVPVSDVNGPVAMPRIVRKAVLRGIVKLYPAIGEKREVRCRIDKKISLPVPIEVGDSVS